MGLSRRRGGEDGLRAVLMRQAGRGHELVESELADDRASFDLASFAYGVSFGVILVMLLVW